MTRYVVWEALNPSADNDLFANPGALRVRGNGIVVIDVATPRGREPLTLPVNDGDIITHKQWDGTFDGPGHYVMALRPATTVALDHAVGCCTCVAEAMGAVAVDGEPVFCGRCPAQVAA